MRSFLSCTLGIVSFFAERKCSILHFIALSADRSHDLRDIVDQVCLSLYESEPPFEYFRLFGLCAWCVGKNDKTFDSELALRTHPCNIQ